MHFGASFSRLVILALLALLTSVAFAQVYKWQSDFNAGEKALKDHRYRIAEDYFRAAAKDAASFDATDERIGKTMVNLGLALSAQRKFDQADTFLTQAVLFYIKIKGPKSPEAMAVEIQLGDVKASEGLADAAEAFYKSALDIAIALSSEDGEVSINIRLKLADLYFTMQRYDDAINAAKLAQTSLEKKSPDKPDVVRCLVIQAAALINQKKTTDAEVLLKRSVEIGEKNWGADSPNLLWSLGSLGNMYKSAGRYADAEPYYRRIKIIREKSYPNAAVDNTYAACDLAAILVIEKNYAEAEQLLGAVLNTRMQVLGPNNPSVALATLQLADIYTAEGKAQNAIPMYNQALELLKTAQGTDPQMIAGAKNSLGLALLKMNDLERAEPLLRESLAAREAAGMADNPDVADSLAALGQLDTAQEKYDEAEKYFTRAIKIRETAFGVNDFGLVPVLENFAALLVKLDRREEAATVLGRARTLKAKQGGDPKLTPAPVAPAIM